MKIRSLGFPIRSSTNWAVQPQKMVRGLNFRIYKVEDVAELKELISYSTADVRLCFHICKKVFS